MDPLDGLERCFQHTQTLMAMIALKRAIKGFANEPICMVDGAADANKTSSNPFLRAGVWSVRNGQNFCTRVILFITFYSFTIATISTFEF